jgi:hypothetical protein
MQGIDLRSFATEGRARTGRIDLKSREAKSGVNKPHACISVNGYLRERKITVKQGAVAVASCRETRPVMEEVVILDPASSGRSKSSRLDLEPEKGLVVLGGILGQLSVVRLKLDPGRSSLPFDWRC